MDEETEVRRKVTEERERLEEVLRQTRMMQHLSESAPPGVRPEGAPEIMSSKQRFWLIELWTENRQAFKDFVKHALLFVLLLGSLEGLHRLLERSTLPPDEVVVLNKLHFYMYAIILVIFAFSFIIKVVKSEFWGE